MSIWIRFSSVITPGICDYDYGHAAHRPTLLFDLCNRKSRPEGRLQGEALTPRASREIQRLVAMSGTHASSAHKCLHECRHGGLGVRATGFNGAGFNGAVAAK